MDYQTFSSISISTSKAQYWFCALPHDICNITLEFPTWGSTLTQRFASSLSGLAVWRNYAISIYFWTLDITELFFSLEILHVTIKSYSNETIWDEKISLQLCPKLICMQPVMRGHEQAWLCIMCEHLLILKLSSSPWTLCVSALTHADKRVCTVGKLLIQMSWRNEDLLHIWGVTDPKCLNKWGVRICLDTACVWCISLSCMRSFLWIGSAEMLFFYSGLM